MRSEWWAPSAARCDGGQPLRALPPRGEAGQRMAWAEARWWDQGPVVTVAVMLRTEVRWRGWAGQIL